MYPEQTVRRDNVVESINDIEESEAQAKLESITPSNAKLLKLAERFPAPQEWYDE